MNHGITCYCPDCDCVLVTDEPHQRDTDGFCPYCNATHNVDWCKVRFDNPGPIII